MRYVIAGIAGTFAGPALIVGLGRYAAWIAGVEVTEGGRGAMLLFGLMAALCGAGAGVEALRSRDEKVRFERKWSALAAKREESQP